MSTTTDDLRFELRDSRNQITWAGNNQVAASGPEFLALLDAAPDDYEVVSGLEVHLADGSWLAWDFDEMREISFWEWHMPRKRGARPMNVLALPEAMDIEEANP